MAILPPFTMAENERIRSQKNHPAQMKRQEAYDFALRIFDLFGRRYQKEIGEQLKGKMTEHFFEVGRALVEIQTSLEQGKTQFAPTYLPKTNDLIRSKGLSQNLLVLFERLKAYSYALLPFPQKALLAYQNPELSVLSALESIRERGISLLMEILSHQDFSEQKELGAEFRRSLEIDEAFTLSRLYYRGGAIVFKRIIYFSEVVDLWGSLSTQNLEKVEQLKGMLVGKEWVLDKPEPSVSFFSFPKTDHPEMWPFQKYLISCSILSIEANLEIAFLQSVKDRLAQFMEIDSIRSDLCYFSASPSLLYLLNIDSLERRSSFLVRAFQLVFYVSQNFKISKQEEASLLAIIVHRDKSWRPDHFFNFQTREWGKVSSGEEDITAFRESWMGLEEILSLTAHRRVSFEKPTTEDAALFANPDCWELLCFLCSHRQRGALIDLIFGLSRLPRFSMNLSSIVRFFRRNGNYIGLLKGFPDAYSSVIQTLERKQIFIQQPESIFFDPPQLLERAGPLFLSEERTRVFSERMKKIVRDTDIQYGQMLGLYILHPQAYLFDLMQDFAGIEIQTNPELVHEMFSKIHPPLHIERCDNIRGPLLAKVKEIQASYRLAVRHIFLIYMEFLRLGADKKFDCIDKISAVVWKIKGFCPALSQETIWFLFFYHPEGIEDKLDAIISKRKNWVEDQQMRSRFVISQSLYQEISFLIDDFGNQASQGCLDKELADIFLVNFKMELYSCFFAYLQPISNFFLITNVTQQDGISWGESIWKTHEGQFKFLKYTDIAVYFHWSVFKDFPVLFMSFSKEGRSISSFISLEISSSDIQKNRRSFFGILSTLAQQVLSEEASGHPSDHAPDHPDSWIRSYVGAVETIQRFPEVAEHMQKIWEFLRKVKLSYRNIYLTLIANMNLPQAAERSPIQEAAQGHIFQSHPRGCLLSFLPKEHPEYFIPDASEGLLGKYLLLFNESAQEWKSLQLDLNTIDGPFPISYQALNVSQFIGGVFGEKENEKAAQTNEREGKYIIIQAEGIKIPLRYPPEALKNLDILKRYFDYHNLVLKAAYYFTKLLR